MNVLLYKPTVFGVSIEIYVILFVLGIPIFFLWRWLLRKHIKNEKTRKTATWIATIISTLFIYAAIIMLWIISISFYPSHDFDKQKWFDDHEKRYELSADIIDSKVLIGKSKEEIREMLGDEENSDLSDNWIYYLGFRPQLFVIDPDYLDLTFKNNKVIKVSQHCS